ncbi:MAG: 4Fe-4S dicluster domain-containing protein, partial [Anaerolineales bacterium]
MTQVKDLATGVTKPDISRRDFLSIFASATFAGLVAPAVLGKATPVQAAPQAQTAGDGLTPLPEVPAPVEGEDPIIRMMEDLRRALEKPIDQRHWIMVIDLRKCTGCIGCTIACVTENKLPPGIAYRPVLVETRGTYPNVSRRFIPRPCMQCDEPPCTPVCPVGATWKREDGIVVI